ncbi:MAG TPA: hypothetical protein VGF28_08920 [Thermoanaerobaculia bacterium]|jgi:hypothetical protein
MKRLSFVFVTLALAACATVPANAPTYRRAPAAPPGKANLYIYRIGAYPTLREPTISVDGKVIFTPPEGAYTVVALEEGQHELKVDWAWDTRWPDLKLPLEIQSRDLYMKISGSFTRSGLNDYEAGSYAFAVEQAVAEREIAACCRFLAPRQ